MASKLNPYLAFPGTAREAMTFYASVLGGELNLTTFEDAGAQGMPDPKQVMHASLETPKGFTLMASDLGPGMEHQAGNNVSLSLSGEDEAELRGYWDALVDGGSTVTMPLETQMWGDVFGMCTDRFGIAWMVNISQPAS